MSPRRICIVGSGNWGSAISRLVGANAAANPDLFHPTVNMWVFEETVDGKKLTEIINTTHENVKYLPGRKLPENVVAVPDIVEAASGADVLGRDSMMIAFVQRIYEKLGLKLLKVSNVIIINTAFQCQIFVIPHQFMERALSPLKGKLKEGTVGISLIKGFMIVPGGGIKLMSESITGLLGIPVGVLMGANLAGEVAADQFCETTIAFNGSKEVGSMFKKAFQTDNFRVSVVRDVHGTEMCGALKNIVACGAGFVDGLKLGDNTKVFGVRVQEFIPLSGFNILYIQSMSHKMID